MNTRQQAEQPPLLCKLESAGSELENNGRTATKDWNGADTLPLTSLRTLIDIRYTLYRGLENVPLVKRLGFLLR